MRKKYKKQFEAVFSKLLSDLLAEVKNSAPGEGITDADIKMRLDNLYTLIELLRELERSDNVSTTSIDELLKKLS